MRRDGGVGAEPTAVDLERIRTRKPEAPSLTVELGSGKQHKIWCTFGPQQIDLDVYSVTGMQQRPGGISCVPLALVTCRARCVFNSQAMPKQMNAQHDDRLDVCQRFMSQVSSLTPGVWLQSELLMRDEVQQGELARPCPYSSLRLEHPA